MRQAGSLRRCSGLHRRGQADSGNFGPDGRGPETPTRTGGSKRERATSAANSASTQSGSEQIRSANPAVAVSIAVCISEPPILLTNEITYSVCYRFNTPTA
ncbi:putative protein OS=Leifsonia shinshuensis OX=150026 GN=HNR13_004201 PE=4 SV=1 [Leifsonia shinshuensis]